MSSLSSCSASPGPAWPTSASGSDRAIGVELHEDADLSLGADIRLSFPLSPLTINPTFDHYFDEDRTLFQIAVNALYYLPVTDRTSSPPTSASASA